MRLNCANCGKRITKDLYQKNKFEIADKEYSIESYISDGSFLKWIDKRERIKLKRKQLLIPLNSYTEKLPEFKSGMGCCNLWREPVYCECRNHIGYANLDCHVCLKCIHIY